MTGAETRTSIRKAKEEGGVKLTLAPDQLSDATKGDLCSQAKSCGGRGWLDVAGMLRSVKHGISAKGLAKKFDQSKNSYPPHVDIGHKMLPTPL
jgi:hypothetical protein